MGDKEMAIKKLEEELEGYRQKIASYVNNDGSFSNIIYLTRIAEDKQRVINLLKGINKPNYLQ